MTASHPIDIPPPPPATGRGGGAGPRSTGPPPVDAAAAQRAVADAMWRTTCERLLPSQEEVDAACAAEPAAAWGFYLPYGYGYAPAGSWSPPYDAYDLGVAVRRTSRPTSSSSSSSASSSPSQSRSPPPHGRKPTRRSKRGGRRGGAAVRARR